MSTDSMDSITTSLNRSVVGSPSITRSPSIGGSPSIAGSPNIAGSPSIAGSACDTPRLGTRARSLCGTPLNMSGTPVRLSSMPSSPKLRRSSYRQRPAEEYGLAFLKLKLDMAADEMMTGKLTLALMVREVEDLPLIPVPDCYVECYLLPDVNTCVKSAICPGPTDAPSWNQPVTFAKVSLADLPKSVLEINIRVSGQDDPLGSLRVGFPTAIVSDAATRSISWRDCTDEEGRLWKQLLSSVQGGWIEKALPLRPITPKQDTTAEIHF